MPRKKSRPKPVVGKRAVSGGAERSEAEADTALRGRPGRRTAAERTEAVLALLSGKASVDQIALRFGVQASTVERWREQALEAIEGALRTGNVKSAQEQQLEKKLTTLEKAFTAREVAEMSRETSRGEANVTQLCGAFGISRQAYYIARRSPGPVEAPTPRPERAGPWATAKELVQGIWTVLRRFPAWGVRKVWAFLRRQGLRASRKRVWRTMQALGLTLPAPKERAVPLLRGHVAVADSNRRWATDLTTTWTRQDGTVALVPVIDCGDRVVFDVAVTKSQEAPAVLAPVTRALEDCFGAPACVPDGLELRSDHGPQYTGSDCGALCQAWRVEQTFAPVGRPTGNAVAERFIETLKVELIWTRDWESLEELREAVREWLHSYNYERPHQALDWMTPAEKREENLGRAQRAA
jgi:putative transposase